MAFDQYNPNGINVMSLVPWLKAVFGIVGGHEGEIQNALANHTALSLVHGLFGGDASSYGLNMPGTESGSRTLYDPFGTGEDNPMYAFRHLDFSPSDRQALFNAVLGGSNDPFLQKAGQEFFALNPDDLNYYWHTNGGYSTGFTNGGPPTGLGPPGSSGNPNGTGPSVVPPPASAPPPGGSPPPSGDKNGEAWLFSGGQPTDVWDNPVLKRGRGGV